MYSLDVGNLLGLGARGHAGTCQTRTSGEEDTDGKNPVNQLIHHHGRYPIIYRVSCMSGG